MEFLISDTFTDSLAKLASQEQKVAKTTAFDLQLNPANPGHKFHRVDKTKDPNFWSIMVSRDLRLIVHKTDSSVLLCYIDHHDKAYRWAEQRKIETHPQTGAAQIVVVRETIKDVIIPRYIETEIEAPALPKLFKDYEDSDLLKLGVPEEWINDVLDSDENSLLNVAEYLPSEAAEALLNIATGTYKQKEDIKDILLSPFYHPDAQRRFRVMNNVEELQIALDFPWEKWTVFLHPAQKNLVEGNNKGPVRVSGTAGTGKTIVGLHRAVYLARANPEARVLLTTFSKPLANSLRSKLRCLISNEPRIAERLEVDSIFEVGKRLYKSLIDKPKIVDKKNIKIIMTQAKKQVSECKMSLSFLLAEWDFVVDAWNLQTWESYRDVLRLGRKTRLPERQRKIIWSIFEIVRARLLTVNLITISGLFHNLADKYLGDSNSPFDYIVIDEAQDISVSQLRFFAALGSDRENSLMFTGDLGQRIFQQPFSWKALGVDIRGRSHTLKVNYRTSHQIRKQADRLLGLEIIDVDGNSEDRRGVISIFNSPKPIIKELDTIEDEIEAVKKWLSDRLDEGILPHEIGMFVRSDAEINRSIDVFKGLNITYNILDDNIVILTNSVSLCTMHLAKGLEFRAVVVMACDDEVIPLQQRLELVTDDSDLEEVYNTERHLLYVACTRARDHLFVSGVKPMSEFLDDLKIEC